MSKRNHSNKNFDNYYCFMQEFLSNHIVLPSILIDEYKQLKLSELELVQLIRIIKQSRDWGKFTLKDIMEEFKVNFDQAILIIQPLLDKGLINESDEAEDEMYSFDGLIKELSEIWFFSKSSQKNSKKLTATEKPNKKKTSNILGKLYQAFEKEFGRGLSPIENDKLIQWLEIDCISYEVIMEALRRAVLQGKTTFNYIDRILINWQKQNLHTVSQIEEKDRYPSNIMFNQTKKKIAPKSPYNSIYNKIYK